MASAVEVFINILQAIKTKQDLFNAVYLRRPALRARKAAPSKFSQQQSQDVDLADLRLQTVWPRARVSRHMIYGTEKNQMSQSLMCSAAQALVQHDVLLQLLKFALEVLDEYVKFMGPIAIALDRLQGKSECFLGLLMPTIQQASKKINAC